MKALTICQPFAHLIATGEKRIENREYEIRYRGPLAIHAGKSKEWLDDLLPRRFSGLVFGVVVGVCELAACVRVDSLAQFARRDWKRWGWMVGHEHAHGTWCWVLENVYRLVSPIEWRGAQGLWNFPESELAGKTLVAAGIHAPQATGGQSGLPLFGDGE